MKSLTKSPLSIYKYLTRRTQEASHQISLFGIVMMVNFPLFGVLWKFESYQLNEEFFLRLIATTLCALLASNQFWPTFLFKLLPVFWYTTLLFCLPFFFTFLTLLNHGATLWLMNCVSAIFFLLLVTSVLDSLVLLLVGVGLAFLCFYLSSHTIEYDPGNISVFSLVITFTAALIIGALFARDRELIHAGRITSMRMLAGSLAHDLRTPLASIHLQAELQEAMVASLNNPAVQKDLKESLGKIIRGIEMGNQLISMQLNNIHHEKKFDTHNFVIYSIQKILEKTLEDYPLKECQKNLIQTNLSNDFPVWIEDVAFKNLIWNLLKNSLDSINETRKGEITIWLARGDEKDDFNYLHIKDTAKGIYPKNIEKIFDSFYSDRKGGTGVGLAYCKLLMEAAGGHIHCEGKLNEYAHFIMKFPKID